MESAAPGRVANLFGLGRRFLSHSTVKNAFLLYTVQLGGYIFPLITLPYLSRVLRPDKFGLIAFAQSFIWYFITLNEYGFNLTATRRIAIERGNRDKISEIFNAVMGAKLLLTVLGFLIMAVAVFATPKLRADWLLFFISYVSVVGALLFPIWLFQGLEKMGHVAARDFIAKLLATILVFVVVRRPSDYLLAAAIQSGATVIAGLISFISVPFVTDVRFALPGWRQIWGALKDGWPVFLSMAALTMTSTTNIFILGLLTSPADVGYYSAAYRIVVAMRILINPIVTALYPYISHMAAQSSENAIRFLRKYSLILAAPFFFGSLVLLLGAGVIVHILFGPQYEPTILIMRILAFSPFVLALNHAYSTYYMLAFGYEKQWSRIIIQNTVLNFVLMALLLLFLKPTTTMAALDILVETYGLTAAYRFYRKQTRITIPVAAT